MNVSDDLPYSLVIVASERAFNIDFRSTTSISSSDEALFPCVFANSVNDAARKTSACLITAYKLLNPQSKCTSFYIRLDANT